MNFLIKKPARLLKNIPEISALAADGPSRRRLARNMFLANLKRTHHGWWQMACRFFGTELAISQLRFPNVAPFSYRPGTTDLLVLEQVFLDREYSVEVLTTEKIEYIMDLGSNIGVTAMLWAQQFPNARMALVEPDPANFKLLQQNTAAFRERCVLFQAAVSDQRGNAQFFRSEREYGHSMFKTDDSIAEIQVRAMTISDVLEEAAFPRLDLLKMDIEGAEEIVMPTISRWKHVPRYLIAELHPPYDVATFTRHCQSVGLSVPDSNSDGFHLNLPFAFRA